MHKEYTKINLLLWNVEGIKKSTMVLADTKDIEGNYTVITTERFIPDSYDIKGFYGTHHLSNAH